MGLIGRIRKTHSTDSEWSIYVKKGCIISITKENVVLKTKGRAVLAYTLNPCPDRPATVSTPITDRGVSTIEVLPVYWD